MVDIFHSGISGNRIKVQIINYVILFSVTNVIFIIIQFSITKLMDKFFIWIDKRKMDKYSLYEWSGEPIWLDFHTQLSSIKDFDPKSLSDNYERIKEEIKKTFNTSKKLTAFKIYLEVKCESTRLNSLLNSTQSIFVALITFSIVTLVSYTELTQMKSVVFIIIFLIVWFGLLMVIDYVSKLIDRNKVLLKLVNECLIEKNSKKRNR